MDASDDVNLTHEGGDSIAVNTLSLSGDALGSGPNGDDLTDGGSFQGSGDAESTGFSDDPIKAGSTLSIANEDLSSGELRLVWTAEGGGSSSTLTTYDYSP